MVEEEAFLGGISWTALVVVLPLLTVGRSCGAGLLERLRLLEKLREGGNSTSICIVVAESQAVGLQFRRDALYNVTRNCESHLIRVVSATYTDSTMYIYT